MTPWYLGVMVDERHAMTLRLDDELYEALRLAAFQQRRHMTEIVTEALREHLHSSDRPRPRPQPVPDQNTKGTR